MGRLCIGIIAIVGVVAPASGQSPPVDPVGEARGLAFAGRQAEATEILRAHVGRHPTDTDARTLLGTILSWRGEYDEARAHLGLVLDSDPTHGDALPALANLELWDDRPDRAENLAASGLAAHPDHRALLMTRARALWSLSREREALQQVDRALELDPGDEAARRLQRALRETQRVWRSGMVYKHDALSGGRGAWQETRYSVARRTSRGSIIGRLYRAARFGTDDHQVEVEAYPSLGPGTYAYVAVAAAPRPVLFPEYRIGGDLYHSLGGGYEVAGGYRRLQFSEPVDIYVASLTKYRGHWMYTGRAFITPGVLGVATSYHGQARRYDANGVGYLGFRYGHGLYRDEVRSLNDITAETSDTFGAEWLKPLGTFELGVSGSLSREGRAGAGNLWQLGLTTSLDVRF